MKRSMFANAEVVTGVASFSPARASKMASVGETKVPCLTSWSSSGRSLGLLSSSILLHSRGRHSRRALESFPTISSKIVACFGSDNAVRQRVNEIAQGRVWDGGTAHAELRTLYSGAADDDYTLKPLWAGEGLDLITGIDSAASIVESIVADAVRRLESADGLLGR